ncbi:Mth938-like domain-containing protein [Agrilutibacter solisilvae]|uniref:Mth938-like domain-containing protein n=1 Tax=Agrilutibacter solisilvae TaxID=2763317 RepID=A0A974XY34_9GAMM|nr:Mth938-like domain-containing protein [Lysobacter solisilvae]QSX77043.1 Mth938-like domain-containing protein [Lysobacter solisilvae]
MQLNLEHPDHEFLLRGADGALAVVNDRRLTASFILATDRLIEDWPVRDIHALQPADLAPVLALEPEVILLGTGERQVFPAAVIAAAHARGVGLEAMTNAAAARTFNVLASEGRRVVAAFVLTPAA